MSHCTNVQVIFSQGAKLHSFPNKLSRYILQEEWKVSRNIVVFCNIQKHNFFYFLARIEYMKESSNTGVRHKENDKAVHLPFQERVHAFWKFILSSQIFLRFSNLFWDQKTRWMFFKLDNIAASLFLCRYQFWHFIKARPK